MTIINIDCHRCNGTGVVESTTGPPEGHTCRHCEGSGSTITGNVILDSGTFDAYQVLECLDATEHNALTDTQKDGVLHLLACGRVDLNDGKAGKTRLWNWFGAESTTVAALQALIDG